MSKLRDGVIDYNSLNHPSENKFLINHDGLIMCCRHPEKTITDPVGMNFFGMLWPEYRQEIKEAINRCLETGEPQDVDFIFTLAGESRRKIGIMEKTGDNITLTAHRVAMPQQNAIEGGG